jgi:UDP-glucose 4-epimerase
MKKILITGSSGYIGSHLCKMLENEYEVHGLDIRMPQVPVKNFHQVSINQPFNIIEEYDCVIHLAALVRVNESVEKPTEYYTTNLNGTINVLEDIPCKNFIFASTGAAANPVVPYSLSKRCAEDVVKEWRKDKDYTIFRFYNVIGTDGVSPTNPDGLFSNLINAEKTGTFNLFGNDYNTPDGTCVRDYVHVMEICRAIQLAIETPANGLENLGHGVGHTVLEMATTYQKVNNCKFDINHCQRREGDLEYSVLDNVSPYMKELYSFEELMKK